MLRALVLAALTACLYLAPGVAPWCSVTNYAMDLRSCFKMRKLDGEVMIHNKPTIVETSLQLEGLLHDPRRVCGDKETFASLYDCLGGTTTKCVNTDEERSYLPDTALIKAGLEYFCGHLNDINEECYNESYSNVFECVKNLYEDNVKSEDTPATRACTTVDITHDCIQVHASCDEKTRDLLLKFQDEYRKPTGCDAPTRKDRKIYITPTGGSTGVFVSKLFCICLSFIIILLQSD